MIRPIDAYAMSRVVCGMDPNLDTAHLSPAYRDKVERLAALDPEDRGAEWLAMEGTIPDWPELAEAMARVDRDGPPPEAETPEAQPASPHATARDDDDDTPLDLPAWPEGPGDAAYHGVLGRIARKVEPATEADPVAILAQSLVMFGSAAGREPHFKVESTYHHLNEFVVLVGDSAIGRKGTAFDRAVEPVALADPDWHGHRVLSGLSSGEGLIYAVRDPTYRNEPIKQGGRIVDYQEVMADAGVSDKRLLVYEPELGRTLAAQGRQGNTLSAILRQAWDGRDLAVMTKLACRATRPHVSIIGHITAADLRELLTGADVLNGFANRFLWIAPRRTKLLPFGGKPVDLADEATEIAEALAYAKSAGRVELAQSARKVWETAYGRLSDVPAGALGTVLSRGAPHVLRLAAIYALADRSIDVADDHLNAALALWDASARCAAYIFGRSLGCPEADRILAALRDAGADGLTRTDIYSTVFGRHLPAAKVKAALATLVQSGQALETVEPTAGRPVARYHAAQKAH
jgi:hypothetical protein